MTISIEKNIDLRSDKRIGVFTQKYILIFQIGKDTNIFESDSHEMIERKIIEINKKDGVYFSFKKEDFENFEDVKKAIIANMQRVASKEFKELPNCVADFGVIIKGSPLLPGTKFYNFLSSNQEKKENKVNVILEEKNLNKVNSIFIDPADIFNKVFSGLEVKEDMKEKTESKESEFAIKDIEEINKNVPETFKNDFLDSLPRIEEITKSTGPVLKMGEIAFYKLLNQKDGTIFKRDYYDYNEAFKEAEAISNSQKTEIVILKAIKAVKTKVQTNIKEFF